MIESNNGCEVYFITFNNVDVFITFNSDVFITLDNAY